MNNIFQSPLGRLTITVVDSQITSVVFGEEHPQSIQNRGVILSEVTSDVTKSKDPLAFDTNKTNGVILTKKVQQQLDSYLTGKLKIFDLPLHYKSTPFQMKVWNYLRTIPYGQTMSYQAIAKAIGHPRSARAVGTACKHNPILIIIPCHRVVKSSGEVGEYAGGKKWKEQLLRLERT